jgi:hypothetical protein
MAVGKKEESGRYILLIREVEEAKMRYFTAKKLNELWPEVSVTEWKAKLDKRETLILMKSDNLGDVNERKKALDEVCSTTEITEQKTIGGARVF